MADKNHTVDSSILLVDDEPFYYKLLKDRLKATGYSLVDFASTAEIAFEKAHENHYDVIVIDLLLPDMDGFALLERFHEDLRFNDTLLVVVTARSRLGEEKERALRLGADDYLLKPFQPDELIARIAAARRRDTDVASPAEETAQQVLDTRLGIQKVGGEIRNYQELLADFMQELPERVQRLYKFYETWDLENFSRAAHNLKAVAANLGAMQLSDLARRLEEQGSTNQADGLKETLQSVEATANLLSSYATKFLNNKEI